MTLNILCTSAAALENASRIVQQTVRHCETIRPLQASQGLSFSDVPGQLSFQIRSRVLRLQTLRIGIRVTKMDAGPSEHR